MDTTTHRRVGKSELTVSPLGFGGAPIGSPRVSNRDSLETVAAAWNSGVRFFDTAPWYGVGRSERRLGLALAEAGAREGTRALSLPDRVGEGRVTGLALARIIHEARSENVESAGDSRPSDRRSPEAYLQYVEDGRREKVVKIRCFRRSQ